MTVFKEIYSMSKKGKADQVSESVNTQSVATLSADLKQVLAMLTPDELARFNTLPADSQEQYLVSVRALKTGLEDFVNVEFEVAPDNDSTYHIFSVPTANNAGDLKAGSVIAGEFLGFVPMISMEPKKNWDKFKLPTGQIVYMSGHYRFKNPRTGDEFGIYAYSNLWELQKVPTLATEAQGLRPAKNPLVKIEYIGLVEGTENLAKYGVETEDGDKSHIFRVSYEKGLKVNKYIKGCINMTRSPIPNLGEKGGEELDGLTKLARDFAQTKGISLNAVLGVEEAVSDRTQIAMQ
jgi:hypothetical protein